MPVRYTFAAGTSAEWAVSALVLAVGQPGYETDTKIVRVGDGASLFPQLPAQVLSDPGGVTNVKRLSQAQYTALGIYSPTTLYVIV